MNIENFAAMAYGVLASIAVGVIFGIVWGSVRMRQHTMATPLYKFSWKRFFLFGLTGAVVCLVAVFWSGAASADCRPDSALFVQGGLGHNMNSDNLRSTDNDFGGGPLATLNAGIRYSDFRLFYAHTSDPTELDRGINAIMVDYTFEFGLDGYQ